MSIEQRKANNKLAVRPLSPAYREAQAARAECVEGSARDATRRGVEAAIAYCAPWRTMARTAAVWLTTYLPIQVVRFDGADTYLRVGYKSWARTYKVRRA